DPAPRRQARRSPGQRPLPRQPRRELRRADGIVTADAERALEPSWAEPPLVLEREPGGAGLAVEPGGVERRAPHARLGDGEAQTRLAARHGEARRGRRLGAPGLAP